MIVALAAGAVVVFATLWWWRRDDRRMAERHSADCPICNLYRERHGPSR
jgi:hypothetical protein